MSVGIFIAVLATAFVVGFVSPFFLDPKFRLKQEKQQPPAADKPQETEKAVAVVKTNWNRIRLIHEWTEHMKKRYPNIRCYSVADGEKEEGDTNMVVIDLGDGYGFQHASVSFRDDRDFPRVSRVTFDRGHEGRSVFLTGVPVPKPTIDSLQKKYAVVFSDPAIVKKMEKITERCKNDPVDHAAMTRINELLGIDPEEVNLISKKEMKVILNEIRKVFTDVTVEGDMFRLIFHEN